MPLNILEIIENRKKTTKKKIQNLFVQWLGYFGFFSHFRDVFRILECVTLINTRFYDFFHVRTQFFLFSVIKILCFFDEFF